ncbi:unannotated protein [freshwater metagenome]|uniref:Unannotated protein n=1 Tax=freshwater metagenome TaxID=449393 RepID=A0A6J6VGZ5_9ZZZZ|nr:thioesterase family protein [Actinomycetota bacterium]MSV63877.1 thioesterase [Actinomycetota bacterium]MSW26998.1 thioesterase [Actinomycetota bacterium]MSW34233.1 thioesterase [Actinomycetota bacterium]MSX30795.1 thioesterase [Actinomycetota bacterium]
MIHHASTHVRWDDLDAFGHINNAAYLTLMQEARADFTWYSRKLRGEKPIFADMVVARAEVDYLEPIHQGGIIVDVAITVSRMGTSSFDLHYVVTHDGVVRASGKTVQVAVSMETQRSRPLSDLERDFLTQYLEVLVEGK